MRHFTLMLGLLAFVVVVGGCCLNPPKKDQANGSNGGDTPIKQSIQNYDRDNLEVIKGRTVYADNIPVGDVEIYMQIQNTIGEMIAIRLGYSDSTGYFEIGIPKEFMKEPHPRLTFEKEGSGMESHYVNKLPEPVKLYKRGNTSWSRPR